MKVQSQVRKKNSLEKESDEKSKLLGRLETPGKESIEQKRQEK